MAVFIQPMDVPSWVSPEKGGYGGSYENGSVWLDNLIQVVYTNNSGAQGNNAAVDPLLTENEGAKPQSLVHPHYQPLPDLITLVKDNALLIGGVVLLVVLLLKGKK